MAVKGSRSTSNYSAIVDVEIGKMKVRNVEMMITPVSDYDILLSMDDLTRMGAVIDCQKNSIFFPKYKVRVHCNGNSAKLLALYLPPPTFYSLLSHPLCFRDTTLR